MPYLSWLRGIPQLRNYIFRASKYNCSRRWDSTRTADSEMVKVLNVAEKNDAAKNIARILSQNTSTMKPGRSKYNKIYEFRYTLFGRQCNMVMTSVAGHLLHLEFQGQYKIWQACNPVALFDAPVGKGCLPDYMPIKLTLEQEIRGAEKLIIWTDCDREGEGIGGEIIEVCRQVKPNIDVYRARFSEITLQSITRACQNLGRLDQRISDAVDVRTELDLRIGAAFTRFQTLRFQKVFPILADSLISYGSCQFPTLGFVVERYKQILDFVEEPFWKLSVTHMVDGDKVTFLWKRDRLFDHTACLILYQLCEENQLATVLDVQSKPKSKWRPLPLDTVELEKAASRKLRINAIETMKIAEKLYVQGFISYPRTETNIFPKELDLRPLVENQIPDPAWGDFARKVLDDGPDPRQGKKTDQAHPPIHPTKYTNSLQGNDKKVYEFIVRHFLACLSKNAEGYETNVVIQITEEKFTATGLMIIAKNYLEVYPYEKWSDKSIPIFQLGQTFIPTSIEMIDGSTSPPSLLTEADLIALMEKHGIGTDATHAEHIEKIKNRAYVGVVDGKFTPGELGMGLVEGYDAMGFEMSKPHLRADLEADLKAICLGTKDPQAALQDQINRYREVFVQAVNQVNKIDEALARNLKQQVQPLAQQPVVETVPVMKCPNCGSDMTLRTTNNKFYIGCMGFPQCKKSIWMPSYVKELKTSEEYCAACRPSPVRKLKFTFERGSMPPVYPNEYLGCVGGCDQNFLTSLGVSLATVVYTPTRPATPAHAPRNRNVNEVRTNQADRVAPIFHQPLQPTTPNERNRRQTPARQPSRTTTPRTMPPPPRPGSHSDLENSQAPNCVCGVSASQKTVRKEGPNTGRKFYTCDRSDAEGRCNFFEWATDEDNTGATIQPTRLPQTFTNHTTTRPPQRQTFNRNQPTARGNDNQPPNCNCQGGGTAARLFTVHKEGPNQGRKFYSCSNGRDNGCGYFLWEEENEHNHQDHQPNNAGRGRGRGRGGAGQGGAGQGRQNDGQPRASRKCGNCGQEGHNKRNCDRNK